MPEPVVRESPRKPSEFIFTGQQSAEQIWLEANRPNCADQLIGLTAVVAREVHKIKPYYDQLNPNINNYFNKLRAVSLLVYGFGNPKFMPDDRLAENLDVIFDCFKISSGSAQGIDRKDRRHQFLDYMNDEFVQWTDFLIRTPTEYFKTLVYKLGIRSIEDLAILVRPFARAIQGNEPKVIKQGLTESLSRMRLPILELMLGEHQASSIAEFSEILSSGEWGEIGEFLGRIPENNLRFIVDSGGFTDLNHVRYFIGDKNSLSRNNLISCDLQRLLKLVKILGISDVDSNGYVRDLISISYNMYCEPYITEIVDKNLFDKAAPCLGKLLAKLLVNPDYILQNLYSITELLKQDRLQTDIEVQEMEILIKRFNGFTTPRLAELVFEAADRDSKDKVFADYEALQRQVLGSEAIDVKDEMLTAEVIYLAYRPTGVTLPDIQRRIKERTIPDLSQQLDRLVVRRDGYPMHFKIVRNTQVEEFDINKLSLLDSFVTKPYDPSLLLEASSWAKCLSYKPDDLAHRPIVLGAILQSAKDIRVGSYRDNYRNGKVISSDFSQERLGSLQELFAVIPNEPEFRMKIRTLLEEAQIDLCDQIERYQWKLRKGKYNSQQIEDKHLIEKAIKELEKDEEFLPVKNSLSNISEFCIPSCRRDALVKLPRENLSIELSKIRRAVFLGIAENTAVEDFAVDTLIGIFRSQARDLCSQIKAELKKIRTVVSDETVEVQAFISKNIGSFYAKAGAEICTAGNIPMWLESRHFHLNVALRGQIIMNNMLYFEESEELSPFLIARGINPRRDVMMMFDRRSMAEEITKVLATIAKDNNRDAVYIPEQTAWHALSNRDGMAVEMIAISERNRARANHTEGKLQAMIETNAFSYTTQRDVSDYYDKTDTKKLFLLTEKGERNTTYSKSS